jgi:hypothetical protein
MHSAVGRPSVPPERLLKASLLMALYTVRSDRPSCEQLDYNLLFRWFLDMNMEEESLVPTVFTKNRQRLIEHDVANRHHCLDPKWQCPLSGQVEMSGDSSDQAGRYSCASALWRKARPDCRARPWPRG